MSAVAESTDHTMSECTCKPHPIFGHEDGCRYQGMGKSVRIAPDAARDARVAARRAEDARRAGAALTALLGDVQQEAGRLYIAAWEIGYAASQLHHNRHYGVSDLAEIDRNARAYGWEVGRRGIEPTAVTETSEGNPFIDPDWRDRMAGRADAYWSHDLCGRAFGFAGGYDPNDPNDPCPGCGACSGSWAVVP